MKSIFFLVSILSFSTFAQTNEAELELSCWANVENGEVVSWVHPLKSDRGQTSEGGIRHADLKFSSTVAPYCVASRTCNYKAWSIDVKFEKGNLVFESSRVFHPESLDEAGYFLHNVYTVNGQKYQVSCLVDESL